MYFTDWRQGGIVAVQRSDPSTATIMRKGVDKMYSIRVYDQDEQPVSGKYAVESGITHSFNKSTSSSPENVWFSLFPSTIEIFMNMQ